MDVPESQSDTVPVNTEHTGKVAASKAGQILSGDKSTTDGKIVAGSALAQTPRKKRIGKTPTKTPNNNKK